jgi:hypothetical protein
MGLKWSQGLVIPLSYCPGMNDGSNANRLRTISLSVLPAAHGILRNEKGKDGSNIGAHLMLLAKEESEDGTRTPANQDARTIPSARTENEPHGMTPPAPTRNEAGTTMPALTRN